jgi:hypothetical protein
MNSLFRKVIFFIKEHVKFEIHKFGGYQLRSYVG